MQNDFHVRKFILAPPQLGEKKIYWLRHVYGYHSPANDGTSLGGRFLTFRRNVVPLEPWRWRHYAPWNRRKTLTQRRSVTSQKNGVLSYSNVNRNSAYLLAPVYWLENHRTYFHETEYWRVFTIFLIVLVKMGQQLRTIIWRLKCVYACMATVICAHNPKYIYRCEKYFEQRFRRMKHPCYAKYAFLIYLSIFGIITYKHS